MIEGLENAMYLGQKISSKRSQEDEIERRIGTNSGR